MCLACVKNPFKTIDEFEKVLSKYDRQRRAKIEAKLFHLARKKFESENVDLCDDGKDVVAEIKKHQYNLAKEL